MATDPMLMGPEQGKIRNQGTMMIAQTTYHCIRPRCTNVFIVDGDGVSGLHGQQPRHISENGPAFGFHD